jgi:hypothetical protein
MNFLGKITEIRGTLFLLNLRHQSGATFMAGLMKVDFIRLENNFQLVDARFPVLMTLGGVSVVGCDRLCPARYPRVGTSPSDIGCADFAFQFYLLMVGNIAFLDVSPLSDVMTRVIRNVTNNQVASLFAVCLITHLLQWEGSCRSSIVERGPNWASVIVQTSEASTSFIIGTPTRNIIASGRLSSFAATTAERQLFVAANVSVLSSSRSFLTETGYNTGNYLRGLK